MLDAIQKGLDREFVVGHLLPAVVLLVLAPLVFLFDSLTGDGVIAFEDIEEAGRVAVDNYALALLVASLGALLVAALLQAGSPTLIRWLEGWYLRGSCRLPAPLRWLERAHDRLADHLIERRRRQFEDRLDEIEPLEGAERDRRIVATIAEYPCEFDPGPRPWPGKRPRMQLIERKLRPFKFGNVVESVGSYSYKLYGMPAQTFWPRLRVVLPDGCRRAVTSARAYLDFMANLWFVWWLLLVESVLLAVVWARWEYLGFAAVALACVLSLTRLTRVAAAAWGETVRTAFDIGRHHLARELGADVPESPAEERVMWRRLGHPMFVQMRTDGPRRRPLRRARLPGSRPATPGHRVGSLPAPPAARARPPSDTLPRR